MRSPTHTHNLSTRSLKLSLLFSLINVVTRVGILTTGQGRETGGPPTLLWATINTESVGGEEELPPHWLVELPITSDWFVSPWHWRTWRGGARGGRMFAGWGERFLCNSPYLASLFRQNVVADLINTSIRRDCINTRLITAAAAAQHSKEIFFSFSFSPHYGNESNLVTQMIIRCH